MSNGKDGGLQKKRYLNGLLGKVLIFGSLLGVTSATLIWKLKEFVGGENLTCDGSRKIVDATRFIQLV